MSGKIHILQGVEEKKKGIHYEVDTDKKLGEGGMGRVYYGYRVDEKRGIRNEVAVKFLYGNLMEDEIRRARREASIQLRNDNLVEMYGLVEIKTTDQVGNPVLRLHVVSEYLNGVTLLDLMNGKVTDKFGNTIPKAQEFLNLYKEKRERFAVDVLKKVLSGIQALHDAGYIHRDIDPSNIMLTDDGHIKLIDFGVAHKMVDLKGDDHMRTIGGTIIGKFGYAAPELVLGDIDNHNETTDIYALGILLFQMLTGHLPFTGTYNEIVQAQIHKPLPLQEIEDERLREIINKATEKEQINRYASAAEFRVALDKYHSLRPTLQPEVMPQPKPQPKPKSKSLPKPESQAKTQIVTGSDSLYEKPKHSSEPDTKKTVVDNNPLNESKDDRPTNGIENKTVVNNVDPIPPLHNSGNLRNSGNSSNSNIWLWYILVALAAIIIGVVMAYYYDSLLSMF